MPNDKHPVPKTDRERRMRWVRMQKVEMGEENPPGTRYPTTEAQRAAARRRQVELMCLEAGLPPPQWDRVPKEMPGPIDDTPWRAARQASLRAQHERFGWFGLAFARDGTVRCVKCQDVVLAIPRDRPFAMGTPVSALAMRHAEATGCR